MSDAKQPKVALVPSEQVVAKTTETFEVIDKRARVIVLRKPGVLAQFRLVDMMGESAKNQVYMGMVLPVIYVVKIDDDDVAMPATKREVEALIQRLDEDGIDAVMTGVQEHFGAPDPEADKQALRK